MTLHDWASRWVTRLVKDGGAHGPGSKRTIKLTDDSFSYSYDAEADLAALRRAHTAGSAGRAAVTYEEPYQGGNALWIDAVRFEDGAVVESIRLVQPYKKRLLGKTSPVGSVIDRTRDLDA